MIQMNNLNECAAYIEQKATIVNGALQRCMESIGDAPDRIKSAMGYSLLSGGKRIRSVMLLAADEMLGGNEARALPFACAIEMIHTYSLIHDDLPAMDNDTLRRGKPTNHVVFGEATAILAGDGLLNLAFEVMIAECLSHGNEVLLATQYIAKAAGISGMIGGQVLDIASTGQFSGEDTLQEMHMKKTGALLSAAVLAGISLNQPPQHITEAMARYGHHIGMLFQITDDILDCIGSTDEMGKTVGKDAADQKTTYVSLYGLEKAKRIAQTHAAQASEALSGVHGAGFFRQLAQYILERKM